MKKRNIEHYILKVHLKKKKLIYKRKLIYNIYNVIIYNYKKLDAYTYFTEENLKALFKIFDVTDKGYISNKQYLCGIVKSNIIIITLSYIYL